MSEQEQNPPPDAAGAESIAEIASVKGDISGENFRQGVSVLLGEGDNVDQVYLDPGQARQLRDEISSLQSLYNYGGSCTAKNRCVRGVARCRPSPTEIQAICPSYYYTADGRQGIQLSTPRHAFDFPYVEPSVFAYSFAVALGELTLQPEHE